MSSKPPLQAVIIPVTPLQQNCTLLWCTATMRGAFVDPGGEIDKLIAVSEQHGVTIEKLLITHGHIDHCGLAGVLAERLGVPIEGPHPADKFWIDSNPVTGAQYGIAGATAFTPDRWLAQGDRVTVGELTFDVYHCPGHTPAMSSSTIRHRILRSSATCCSRARSGAPTFRSATTPT